MKQLIHGGRVLTAGRLGGEHADVLIEDDTILAVLPAGESVSDDARRIDATNRLLIPGLVNAHTHATVHLSKAMADRWSLELLLNAYPWTAGGRTLEYKYLSAFIGAVEMVRKGCTACYDLVAEIPAPSVEGIEAVARAYNDVGMRAVIAPMMADVSFYRAIPGLLDAIPPPLRERAAAISLNPFDVTLATCRQLLAKWSWDRDRLRPALGPTIPHHCTDAFIIGCRDLAKEHGIGVQMHVAESKVQAVVGVKRYGTTLVGHLHRLGLLAPNFTAAHAIWLDDDDIGRLADAGASVAHNPGSNLKLGSGLAATRKFRDRGVTFGIGTDGCISSDNLNMFEAMRMAAFLHKLQSRDPRVVSAKEALQMATIGGARALGMERQIGSLERGKRADLIVVGMSAARQTPMYDPISHLVYVTRGDDVRTTIVNGKVLMRDRKMLTLNEPAILQEARGWADKVRAAVR